MIIGNDLTWFMNNMLIELMIYNEDCSLHSLIIKHFDIVEWLENIHLHEHWYWMLNQGNSTHKCQFGKNIAYIWYAFKKIPHNEGHKKEMIWKFGCRLWCEIGWTYLRTCQTSTYSQLAIGSLVCYIPSGGGSQSGNEGSEWKHTWL